MLKRTHQAGSAADPESFVPTATEDSHGADDTPMRLVDGLTPGFMDTHLEHQGYCAWTLVTRAGLLLPGDPALGVIRYKGKSYSLCSVEAMQAFCADPIKYVEGVDACARKMPQLVHLLGLQNSIPHTDISELLTMGEIFGDGRNATSGRCEVECQTPDGYINTDPADPNYEWNEWELRRKAIQMANLTSKKTHSAQTNLSHFRRDNDTQVYLPREAGTMTGVEKGTNVARTERYVKGLRGQPSAKASVVTLTMQPVVVEGSNPPLNRRSQ